jgi:tripartite-type tricarboxylate transporter receptor subunit TctC
MPFSGLYLALAFQVIFVLTYFPSANAAMSAPSTFEGQRIQLVVYTSPGSGHDTLARLAARFLPRHIPGNPRVIVQNVPGGGGVIAANHMFGLAEPDGLSVGVLSRGMPILSLVRAKGIEYDALKFRWVGSPSFDNTVCVASAAAGFKDIRDVIGSEKQLTLGATGRAAGSFQVPSVLNAALGTKIKIIVGYKGAPEMHAAMERGEIDGRCFSSWSTKSTSFLREGLESGRIRFLVQLPDRHLELPQVPVANDLIRDPETVTLLNLIAAPLSPWVVPPGTPDERVSMLREGFMRTFQDPGLRQTADRAQIEINPVPGDKVEQMIHKSLNVSEKTRQRLSKILGM